MQDIKITYPRIRELDGKEIFSEGWVVYYCTSCGWNTRKYYENYVKGVVPCDQCGRPVMLERITK